MEKICSKCGACKPYTPEFFPNKGAGKLKPWCKPCENTRKHQCRISNGKYKRPEYIDAVKERNKRKKKTVAGKHRLIVQRVINRALRRRVDKPSMTTRKILGCDPLHFVRHIEQQLSEGMSWENRSEWHIDHIIPLAAAKNEEDFIRLNHYTNLRPLWAIDNFRKGARLDWTPSA